MQVNELATTTQSKNSCLGQTNQKRLGRKTLECKAYTKGQQKAPTQSQEFKMPWYAQDSLRKYLERPQVLNSNSCPSAAQEETGGYCRLATCLVDRWMSTPLDTALICRQELRAAWVADCLQCVREMSVELLADKDSTDFMMHFNNTDFINMSLEVTKNQATSIQTKQKIFRRRGRIVFSGFTTTKKKSRECPIDNF